MAAKKATADSSVEIVNDTGSVQHEFSKEQIITSAKYRKYRDLVNALLDTDKMYTIETVDNMISKFMKGKVK